MTKSEKFIHAAGYISISAFAGAFLALFMVNRKPWLTKKGRLIKTLKDLSNMAEQIVQESTQAKKPRKPRVPRKLDQHLNDEQIDHIRRHGEP